ncbi:MAG: DUF192 domain-containing protein [Nanoarchaeota archaeon]
MHYLQGFSAFWGLRFRTNIPHHTAWIFDLKRSTRIGAGIDMFFVFMEIGVLWLDADKKVIDAALAKPFQMYWPKEKARYVVELHPEHLSSYQQGSRFSFDHAINV